MVAVVRTWPARRIRSFFAQETACRMYIFGQVGGGGLSHQPRISTFAKIYDSNSNRQVVHTQHQGSLIGSGLVNPNIVRD